MFSSMSRWILNGSRSEKKTLTRPWPPEHLHTQLSIIFQSSGDSSRGKIPQRLSGKFEQAAFLETDKNGKKRLEKHSPRTYLKICSSKRRISVAFIRSWRAFKHLHSTFECMFRLMSSAHPSRAHSTFIPPSNIANSEGRKCEGDWEGKKILN